MSKAGEWAKHIRAGKPPGWHGDILMTQMLPQAMVDEEGDLVITDGFGRVRIWQGNAAALARWILDTFEEK